MKKTYQCISVDPVSEERDCEFLVPLAEIREKKLSDFVGLEEIENVCFRMYSPIRKQISGKDPALLRVYDKLLTAAGEYLLTDILRQPSQRVWLGTITAGDGLPIESAEYAVFASVEDCDSVFAEDPNNVSIHIDLYKAI